MERGTITSVLKRGLNTFTCSCASPMLRVYQVEEGEGQELIIHKVCLHCGSTSNDEWRELKTLQSIKDSGASDEYLNNINNE